jgi:predicted PhzF superfamily epimerase YddE/YHI9
MSGAHLSSRTELDFAAHPSVGAACALVMKQHVRLSEPVRLILEENIGPVTVDVTLRNGVFHGTCDVIGEDRGSPPFTFVNK